MIPIGGIEVDFVDPSGLKYFLKTGYEVTARFDERGISTSDIKPPSNLSSADELLTKAKQIHLI